MMNRASKSKIRPPVRPSEFSINRPFAPIVAAPRNARDITGNNLRSIPFSTPSFAPIDPTASIAHHPLIVAASRYVRDAPTGDKLHDFVSNMQVISHIANGISLVSGLTKGTINGNDLVAELLHMGSLKPDTLNSMKPGDFTKLVDILETLTSGLQLESNSGMTELENNLMNLNNVINANTDFNELKTLPGKTDYEAGLITLAGTTVGITDVKDPLTKADDLKFQLEILGTFHELLTTNPAKVVASLRTIHAQSENLEREMNSYKPVMDLIVTLKKLRTDSSFLQILLDESKLRGDVTYIQWDPYAIRILETHSQLFINTTGVLKTEHQAIMNQLNSFVASRQAPVPDSTALTAGFPHGKDDLFLLRVDTEKEWVQKSTNGTLETTKKLGTAMRSLDKLSVSIGSVEKVWEPENAKIEAVEKLLLMGLDLVGQADAAKLGLDKDKIFRKCQHDNRLEGAKIKNMENATISIGALNEAVDELTGLDHIGAFKNTLKPFKDAADFKNITTPDDKKAAAPAMVDALKMLDVVGMIKKLDTLTKDILSLETIFTNLTSKVSEIQTSLPSIVKYQSQLLTTKFENMTTCLNRDVGKDGNHQIQMIKSIREMRALNGTTVFKDTRDFLDTIEKSVIQLNAAKNAADNIKKVTTPEVKSLNLFNKPQVSQDLGLAIQGLMTIEKAVEKRSKLTAVTGDLQLILGAMDRHQYHKDFKNHYNKVQDLENLKTSLTAMYAGIDALNTPLGQLSDNNLKNNGAVFTAAHSIPSVAKVDVEGIKKGLEALATLETKLQPNVTAVSASLDVYDKLDLDFAKFNMNTAPAALNDLDVFFASWTQHVSATAAPPTAPPGSVNNGGGSGGSVSYSQPVGGASVASELPGWVMPVMISGGVILIGLIGGLIAVVYLWKFQKKGEKASSQKVESKRLEPTKPEEKAKTSEMLTAQ